MKTVIGTITSYPKYQLGRYYFTINNDGKNMTLYYKYLNIMKHDTIYAKVTPISDNKWVIVDYPLVLIGKKKESIIQTIMASLKFNFIDACTFYNNIPHTDNLYNTLSAIACSYHKSPNPNLLPMLGVENMQYNLGKFLSLWYTQMMFRQLSLFNLTEKEIEHGQQGILDLIEICMTNPHYLYYLPAKKVNDIVNLLELTIDLKDQYAGEIVRYLYQQLTIFSHVCVSIKKVKKLYPKLDVEFLKQYPVIIDNNYIYLKQQHQIEISVYQSVSKLLESDGFRSLEEPLNRFYKDRNGNMFIRYLAEYRLKTLTNEQKNAIQAALDHRLCLICSAAGCGKSTIIAEIIYNLDLRNLNYLVTSFTGKATDRLRAILPKMTRSNRLATMHKLIYDQNKKQSDVEYDFVIIDEVSMITTELFYNFFKSFPNIPQWVLVGDANQLPPIGPGALLRELIESDMIPTYTLTKNHRVTEDESGLVMQLTHILNAKNLKEHESFEFIECDGFEVIQGGYQEVYDLIYQYKELLVPIDDLVIMTPYKEDLDILNSCVQQIYNPEGKHCIVNKITYKVGDPVILKKNINDKNIFNGQRGKIIAINLNSISVDFGLSGVFDFDLKTKLTSEEDDQTLSVNKLLLGYCLTVHRLQGDERDNCIIYIGSRNHSSFLNNHLIYTALSRAREMIHIVCANPTALRQAVKRSLPYRCENLANRLKGHF